MKIEELMDILEKDYQENKDFVEMLINGKKTQKRVKIFYQAKFN